MAIHMGLRLASKHDVSNIQVYSDVMAEVSKLNSSILSENEDGLIIRDIKQKFISLNVSSIWFMSHSYNVVAHSLARHALNISTHMSQGALNGPSWLTYVVLTYMSTS